MTFEQATRFESKAVTAAEQVSSLNSEALNLLSAGGKSNKATGDQVAIGTCPECSPPFEWPPNEPKPTDKPKPSDKPKK